MSGKFQVLIIDESAENRALIQQTLMGDSQIEIMAETESLVYGYEMIRQNRPHMAFIDLRQNPDKTLETIQRISTYFRDTILVVSGTDINMSLLMSCMQAGAREFINRPMDPEQIRDVVAKYKPAMSVTGGDQTGRIITVFSNKGGLGKTTIATNLAVTLSQTIHKPVALVDLNLQLGDITTFLNLEPKQTIVDIAKNIGRVDATYLENSLAEYTYENAKVYVLADPLNVEEAEEVSAEQINTVLTVLRSTFEYVVIDTTTSFDSKTLAALDLADDILLTSIVNLPCIRSSQRLLSLFERLGYDKDKVKLVVNRYFDGDEITPEDMEDTLEHPVYWKIPNAYQIVMSAINQGVYIGEIPNSKNIVKNFTDFAHQLSGKVSRVEPVIAAGGPVPLVEADAAPSNSLLKKLPIFGKK